MKMETNIRQVINKEFLVNKREEILIGIKEGKYNFDKLKLSY
jgi:hypothetical protein